jgi:predicted metal-dependent TIM-barrel fold hydrolase
MLTEQELVEIRERFKKELCADWDHADYLAAVMDVENLLDTVAELKAALASGIEDKELLLQMEGLLKAVHQKQIMWVTDKFGKCKLDLDHADQENKVLRKALDLACHDLGVYEYARKCQDCYTPEQYIKQAGKESNNA